MTPNNITGSSVCSLPKIPHCSLQKSLGLVSVPMSLYNLPEQLSMIGLVCNHPHQLPNTAYIRPIAVTLPLYTIYQLYTVFLFKIYENSDHSKQSGYISHTYFLPVCNINNIQN